MNEKSSSERLGEALERAKNHWQRARKDEPLETLTALPRQLPTIAVSREAGTNGGEISRALGKRLGWAVYDRELLQRIGEEMGLRAKLLESVDEKRSSWLRECLDAFYAVPTINSSTYVKHLTEVILSLSTHGGCVIVGRGAVHILPPQSTFRVRLIAPLNERIRRIEERFGIPHEEAARWIKKTDRERARFVKEFFQKDGSDPHGYDLVLDVSRFTTEECVKLLHEGLKCWRKPESADAKPSPSALVTC